MRLFLILVAVPIIETALFIEIGGWIGTWPTIGVVILTALIGSMMLRQQGTAALQDVQGRLAAGENPGHMLAEGAMILVAGVLLLTPGFFTDALGFALLIPPIRAALWRYLAPRIRVTQTFHGPHGSAQRRTDGYGQPADGQTVDGTYEDVTPPANENDPLPPPKT